MVSPVMSSALNGIQMNRSAFSRHADNISRYGNTETSSAEESVSLETELIGMLQSRHGIEANLAVLKTEDEMLGSLIDILA